jgi:phosphoglycolate phosphatase
MKKIGEIIAPEFGIDISEIDDAEISKLKKMSFKEIHKYFGIKFYELPKLVKRAKEEFNKIADDVSLIRGMDAVIKELRAEGKVLGILTSNNVGNVEKVLQNNNLEYFNFIYESEKIGGKGKILSNIVKKHGFSAEKTVYIGDEPRDIVAAKKAAIAGVGVTWGLKSKNDLQSEGADFIFENPRGILSIA